MLDFRALKTANKVSASNTEERKKEAELLYKKTFQEFISFYEKDDDSDVNIDKLQQIADSFVEILEKNPKKLEAYICLAHIFIMIQNPDQAYQMLEAAESIDPNSLDVKDLRRILEV